MTHIPKAAKKPHTLVAHAHTRIDDYYWLNERENPEVIAYLEAENEYTKHVFGTKTQALQDTIFAEMRSRIKEDDNSVPYRWRDYFYYVRYETGKEYPIYCRKKGDLTAKEEIILNGNVAAKRKKYFAIMGADISPNQNLWGYAVDSKGRRICNLYIKDLAAKKNLPDKIRNVSGNFVWANDSQTLFYTRMDKKTLRTHQVWRHIVGTDAKTDVLIYEENDETYDVGVYTTTSEKYIVIGSTTTLANEYQILAADNPLGDFKLFQERKRGHEYSFDHVDDTFFMLTNWEAQNFRLMTVAENAADYTQENWKEQLAHRPEVLLESMSIFQNFMVLEERKNGLNHIRIINRKTQEDFYIPMTEDCYSVGVGTNPEYTSDILRFGYESMTTPSSVFDFNMKNKTQELKKQREIPGGYNPNDYQSARIWATANDGKKVPISLVYNKKTKIDGSAPCLLYGYGSYGISMDVHFSTARMSLLDRGFVYAMAHIRGGQDLGRNWYEEGKLFKKMNTFTDFIACGDFLIQEKYAAKDKLCAAGGSAGGLLMGAVVNIRPEMWKAVVASVPFVDVVTTMLDDTIPLTTGEYDEWGNPNEKAYYDYMLSYSPYDNVSTKDYPNMLVITGFHDSQVQYFEPAKWVAKLRELKTDDHILLMHTNMSAGHGGASGRFERLREVAMEYAFLVWINE